MPPVDLVSRLTETAHFHRQRHKSLDITPHNVESHPSVGAAIPDGATAMKDRFGSTHIAMAPPQRTVGHRDAQE